MKSGKSRKELHAESSADHDTCIICGSGNPLGLKLKFDFPEDGLAECEFMPKFAYEGYKGFLQGGVSAALLDGIMTNCLFSHGHPRLYRGDDDKIQTAGALRTEDPAPGPRREVLQPPAYSLGFFEPGRERGRFSDGQIHGKPPP